MPIVSKTLLEKVSGDSTLDKRYNTVYVNPSSANFSQYLKTGVTKTTPNNPLNNLLNVNFLRKERLYTKLKYSRSPAYDIVSGGAAAILAGLLGFLVSEKFGMELVDSGDFYYLFMYGVFLTFSIRPLLVVTSGDRSLASVFSLRRVLNFYVTLIALVLNIFK